MNIENFYLMRNEIMLTIVALVLILVDLNLSSEKKHRIIPIAVVLFLITLIVGFLPIKYGVLFGGMYQSTSLTTLMKGILNIGVFIIFLQSIEWLKKPENLAKISEFFILIIFTLIGMNFMISSGDFLMFYIGLETATIPIAALAAYDRYKRISAEAGIKLILSSALSSGILLWGISMIYGTTGSIYFSEIAAMFSQSQPLQVMAFIFFMSGMAFKISLVPFHLWTADVYEGAPISITSYLSVISKGASVFILMIILQKVFISVETLWTNVLYVIAAITMTVGNLFAIRQQNLKRFLAFSSIAQAGFILLGLIGGSIKGDSAVVYFVMIYIFSNLAAFGVIQAISNATGKENIDDYNGLYSTNPKLSLTMMLALFSLAGIPPVAGFFGKFFLFFGAGEKHLWVLLIIAVVNATISLYYYLLVVKAMLINKSDTAISKFKSDNYMRTGLIICVMCLLTIGFISPIYNYISSIVTINLF